VSAASEPIRHVGRGGPLGRLARAIGARSTGFTAVGVKELRNRMRGRRAFVFLTFYLVVLGGLAWMIELLLERSFMGGFGAVMYASAQIGRGVFIGLLLVETLLVLFLAPAYTTGAISLEREKQTFDLLVTTPISSLAIVLGKLFSALTFVFLLIISSIPLTSLVFVFGGAAPEDVIKGYLMLLVTAVGLGSIGLFCSSLFRRTQAATVVTYFVVLAITLGAFFVWVFWGVMVGGNFQAARPLNEGPIESLRRHPPEALLWFNPFVSAVDVICGTETGFGGTCDIIAVITDGPTFNAGFQGGGVAPAPPAKALDGSGVVPVQPGVALESDVGVPAPIAAPPQQFGPSRDTYWPRAALAWIVLSVILIALSVNLVSPTRRWHRPRIHRGRNRATAAVIPEEPGARPAGPPPPGPAPDPPPVAPPQGADA
jgi:ABC-type transport system involved in multi-copper enzyme maturation permease subunit